MNNCPPQSAAGGGLASISMVSSISGSDSVVVEIVGGGIYIGSDVVDSCIGHSVTVVDSMSAWPTSITASVPINHKKYLCNYKMIH